MQANSCKFVIIRAKYICIALPYALSASTAQSWLGFKALSGVHVSRIMTSEMITLARQGHVAS